MLLRRGTVVFALIALAAANVAMLFIAVTRYRRFFAQPGAEVAVLEPVVVLAIYAGIFIWIGRTRRIDFDKIVSSAAFYGVCGGILEVLNIGVENGMPSLAVPAVTVGAMLVLFGSWAVAGFRTARALDSIGAGVVAAVLSAGICMVIGVAGGFAIEFFIKPPEPAYVATWAEFKRSGWTDAQAFSLANTLDSALTHLLIAPVVALILGGGASLLAQARFGKPFQH